MEIFVFIDFLDNDDFSIGGCYDNLFSVLSEETDRTSEEIHHQQIDCYTRYCYHIKWYFAIDPPIKSRINQ